MQPLNVLMFGWELPPHNSGGLGTACLGLAEALVPQGVNLDFVLPHHPGGGSGNPFRIIQASEQGDGVVPSNFIVGNYGPPVLPHDLAPLPFYTPDQVSWYAEQSRDLALNGNYDVIHSHEWMTFPAALAAQRRAAAKTGRRIPVVAHVHATEIDRGGEHGNPRISAIERTSLHRADRIVAVSHYTKSLLTKYYELPASKISVVHNGIDNAARIAARFNPSKFHAKHKLVLFMGRLTSSKGPSYFLDLAKAISDRDKNVRFVMIGSGDQEDYCIERAAALNLTGKVFFTPFVRGEDVDRAYQMADLFIMPSVSEPFGLVALEALRNGTPAIVSKQSGVSEVSNALIKVDFWDINLMKQKVLETLYNDETQAAIHRTAQEELPNLSWNKAAQKTVRVYQHLLSPQPAA